MLGIRLFCSGDTRKFFVGAIEGAKCVYEGTKIIIRKMSKIADFSHFASGGAEPLTGGCPMPPPRCHHCCLPIENHEVF